MKVGELKKSLTEKVAPFYILKGKDAYLRGLAISAIKELLDPTYFDFNCDEISISMGAPSIFNSLSTLPMFDNYRIVFVKEMNDKLLDADYQIFEKYLLNPPSNVVLVMVIDRVGLINGEGTKTVKSLEKFAQVVNCEKMDAIDIEYEIEKILSQEKPCTIDKAAIQTLVNFTGGDMQRIYSELKKLQYFTDGNINRDEVEELVAPEMEAQIYELSNALGEKNATRTMYILSTFFKYNMSPIAVIIVLVNHYRRLLAVTLAGDEPIDAIAEKLSVKPFAVVNLKKQAKNFTQRKLKEIVDYLEDVQFDVLKGSYSETSALKNVVLNLM